MPVFRIDSNSTEEEIEDFYNLYVESFRDLCMWKNQQIINLADFIRPTNNIQDYREDVEFTTTGIGFIIYYTHNDDVITSIAIVDVDNMSNCFVKIKYLCGNQSTKDEKLNGKSQGKHMLDYIFAEYKNYVILIEPATPELIPYYAKYKKPCFPYNQSGLEETFNYLVYGNVKVLRENCFTGIFRSIKFIDSLVNILEFRSLDDLYSDTYDINSLKKKLLAKLKNTEIHNSQQMHKQQMYKNICEKINGIKYYDINDIITKSTHFAGGKRTRKSKKTKQRTQKNK